jgi:hypothetical protein
LVLELPGAYEELAGKRVKFTSRSIKLRYLEMVEIIVLKGLYYLRTLTELNLIDPSGFGRLSVAIDKLLDSMDQSSEFALVSIAIKSSISPRSSEMRALKSVVKSMTIDNYGSYFSESFRFWINQRTVLSKLDESNFCKHAPSLAVR